MTPLQKLRKNGEDWGKLIGAKGFKKLPKVQNIDQSGHTGSLTQARDTKKSDTLPTMRKSTFSMSKDHLQHRFNNSKTYF